MSEWGAVHGGAGVGLMAGIVSCGLSVGLMCWLQSS